MFLDHHHKSLKEKIILEDSFEYRWPAMLGLTWQSKPCILHGWKEFAEDHNLQIGDQVVFFLVAKSHFMVQVFDADNNAKRKTRVADQYNNPNISVPKGKTNKFSKSIENDEETSARTKCNPNLQPKGLCETGATNDKSAAKHTFASVKVKIEGEAPDSNRRRNTETQKAPQCDTDDSIMKAPQCPARTAGELSPWVSFIRQRRTSSPSSSERWNMATLGKQVYGGLWARFREEPGADNP
jgi:hypothetical protein